jgi:hypothetical protein
MPQLSLVYGITIRMDWSDHQNPVHFDVESGGQEALVVVADGRVLAGNLPPRALTRTFH